MIDAREWLQEAKSLFGCESFPRQHERSVFRRTARTSCLRVSQVTFSISGAAHTAQNGAESAQRECLHK